MMTLSADRIGGLIWIAFGGAVVYGSWAMDRLESLNIPPSTAPGVVPGLLGLGIIVFGMVLLLRRSSSASEAAAPSFAGDVEAERSEAPFDWKRVLLSWVLCTAYAGLLLGRGIPYWLLTFAFLFLHMVLLDESERVPARLTVRRTIIAAVIAIAIAVVLSLVFRYVFLVRLP
jgi:hypothetical protein